MTLQCRGMEAHAGGIDSGDLTKASQSFADEYDANVIISDNMLEGEVKGSMKDYSKDDGERDDDF